MRVALLAAAIAVLPLADATPQESAAPPQEVRTGEFQLTFTLPEVAGLESARAQAVVPLNEPITWNLYVPDSYDPKRPAGLLVYISPSPSGGVPRPWRSVIGRRNLIWVAAESSGNKTAVVRRALYALVAPTLAANHYRIDPERIYLAGFSGGSRVASMVATDYPQVFKGAVYSGGVEFWDERVPARIEQIRQNHYVFVSGSRDPALQQTKRVHGKYLEAGVANCELIVARDLAHETPGGAEFGRAIEYLDARLP